MQNFDLSSINIKWLVCIGFDLSKWLYNAFFIIPATTKLWRVKEIKEKFNVSKPSQIWLTFSIIAYTFVRSWNNSDGVAFITSRSKLEAFN